MRRGCVVVMGLSVVVTQEGVSLNRLTRGVSVAPTGLSVLGAKGTGTVHFSALRTVYGRLSYRPKSVLRFGRKWVKEEEHG